MNDRRIIILSHAATYRLNAFKEAAQALDIEIVHGLDIDPQLADYWQIPLGLQFGQPEQAVAKIIDFACHHPVQAIISIDDSASVIAAQASEALNLPHNATRAALAARNKFEMRTMFAQADVPSPQFTRYELADDAAQIAATLKYPVVIKPLLLSGSRGVIRANNPSEFRTAFARVKHILSNMAQQPDSTSILVEDYIPGIEVALEGIMDRGGLKVLALFDKPDPLEGPFFEETIYVTPSRLSPKIQADIAACAAQAVAALGLHFGPVHAEMRLNEAGPWILEVAGRSIGGLCSEILQFGLDISLEELILRQAVGLDINSFTRQAQATGVMMIPIPEAGILKDIEGVSEAEKIPLITKVQITAPLNYPLVPLPEGGSYLGFIFANGPTPGAVETALREAHQQIQFKIAPMLSLMMSH